ncbi:IS3 family transposase [Marinisporobacter balticus]|uniref:IS3 family transposase n=1 Tax=Marinisporobacter balticus TaxID=2018667 RepID=UPI001043A467
MKKGYGHIRKEVTTIFEFITNNKKHHDIKLMCRVLKVSRSSYYKYLNKKPSNRELENVEIEKKIINIHKESKNRYGAIKINESLKTLGVTISSKRTQRLMKKLGIKSIIARKYRPTSSKRKIEEQENVLKRDFNTTTINEKWVIDLTYIYTIKDGWCYLASVMDLYSRKIIGYAMSKSIDTNLALQAVKNAFSLQKPILSYGIS